MITSTMPLSQTPPGLRVQVSEILFDVHRGRCEDLGIAVDSSLRCMAWLPDGVLIQLPDGETVSVETRLADFVSVRAEEPEQEGGRGHGRFHGHGRFRSHPDIDVQRGVPR